MSLTYHHLSKKPLVFSRLCGLKLFEFEKILKKLEPLWAREVLGAYKGPGRPFKLNLSDMLLMLFLYYRSYVTHEFLAYLFGIDSSRVCRLFKKLEPLVCQIVKINKERDLSQKELENLLIDATEQKTQRPTKKQKPYYSGKKKMHSLKTEIRTTLEGHIVYVSKPYPGSVHDFKVYKNERPVSSNTTVFLDSGYQGFQDKHTNTRLPEKATKTKKLTKAQKAYNRALSALRVKIENVIGQLKTFNILAQTYRNRKKRYHLRFNIISGVVNLKNGFNPIM